MNEMTCPECGAEMKQRDGRYGKFWGCSTWPKCKATVDVKEQERRELAPSERMAARDRSRWRE